MDGQTIAYCAYMLLRNNNNNNTNRICIVLYGRTFSVSENISGNFLSRWKYRGRIIVTVWEVAAGVFVV